jgi:hypothetical protein
MINPKLTEEFLLAQDDVLDASVWFDGNGLRAHVTPSPGVRLDPFDLKGICAAVIGVEQTPLDIVLIAPRQAS